MSINISQIKNELFPGLYAVKGKYEQIPTQWSQMFDKGTSKMAVERSSMVRYLGLAAIKNEGAATTFDNSAGDRFLYNQEHLEIGLGYAITRKAIDDNLYKEQFDPMNLGLMDSFAQTKEILAANVLNTAQTVNPLIGGDQVALCSTLHPVDGGFNANTFSTQLDLNEAALESASIVIRGFKDQANKKIFARSKKLAVPPTLEFVASRLLNSELRPSTANNDINAIRKEGILSEGFTVMDFLTSNYAWFIRTNKTGLNALQRIAFETDMQVDPVTGNLLCIGYERYSFGYNDPVSIFGSFPTA